MAWVVGKAWGWVRSRSSCAAPESTTVVTPKSLRSGGSWSLRRWTSWIWGEFSCQSDLCSMGEEYWDTEETSQTMAVEDLSEEKLESEANSEQMSRWWKYYSAFYFVWPRKKSDGQGVNISSKDVDGDFSDYGTPPPSPLPPSSQMASPFRLFLHSWNMKIQPEHHEICFNFIRHLFDLFVVGFLWTVSSPSNLILEVLGIQGALRLWFHGMAMFLVCTAGMTGLLWLIQEYLIQFALIYGIMQALVLSVSVRQSVIGEEEEEKNESRETDRMKNREQENTVSEDKKTSRLR
ncbi:uncharacterized protein V6R79_019575 [Siganus canaliculatus]